MIRKYSLIFYYYYYFIEIASLKKISSFNVTWLMHFCKSVYLLSSMLILGRTTKTAASRTELYTYTRSLNRGMTPFGFLLVEFLWHLRLLKGSDLSSASPLEMQFSQSSPLYPAQAQSCVTDKNSKI